jgi:NADPH:quinone reductase-like Zn-dependent oxidoreductase
MTRARKIVATVVALLVVASAALAFALSHDAACGPPGVRPTGVPTMQAIVYRCYGRVDVLRLEGVERPTPGDEEVLVRVRAAALNPLDWHYMTGTPYVMRLDSGLGRPTSERLGVDFAGTVEAVGRNVTRFQPGDEVYGSRWGAFAEYVKVPQGRALVPKPAVLTFAQAAGVPVAAITALQGLRDKAQVKPGQTVLVNGASGGVGSFAVQIAKALGAEVTGVCSTRNVELVRSLGADHVIDYTQRDFTRGGQRYDVVLDAVGNHPLLQVRRALAPEGVHVLIGGPKDERWLGPILGFAKAPLVSMFTSQRFEVLLAEMNEADLLLLNDLMQAGKVTTVIDRRYPLAGLPDAMRYLETRRARGKVVIDVVSDDAP